MAVQEDHIQSGLVVGGSGRPELVEVLVVKKGRSRGGAPRIYS